MFHFHLQVRAVHLLDRSGIETSDVIDLRAEVGAGHLLDRSGIETAVGVEVAKKWVQCTSLIGQG